MMIEPNIDLIHYKPSVQHVLRFSFCIPAWDLCVYQLCPTEIAYWAKKYVAVFTKAAHWTTGFDLSKL